MFEKILIANRGEIAIRVMRACRELDIQSVAIYSDADTTSLYTNYADESYPLGNPSPAKSYLNIEKIIDIALIFKSILPLLDPNKNSNIWSENETIQKLHGNTIKIVYIK